MAAAHRMESATSNLNFVGNNAWLKWQPPHERRLYPKANAWHTAVVTQFKRLQFLTDCSYVPQASHSVVLLYHTSHICLVNHGNYEINVGPIFDDTNTNHQLVVMCVLSSSKKNGSGLTYYEILGMTLVLPANEDVLIRTWKTDVRATIIRLKRFY